MKKILLLGANGFIGRNISNSFPDCYLFSKTRSGSIPDGVDFDYLIDATSQKTVGEVDSLLSEIEYFIVKYKIKKIFHMQSFSSLQGKGGQQSRFNFGLECNITSPYTNVKLHKERVLIDKFSSQVSLSFLYLPIITGDGGVWGNLTLSAINSNKIIDVPNVRKVYFIDVKNIFSFLDFDICSKNEITRVMAFDNFDYLDKILGLKKYQRKLYKYSKYIDFSIYKMYEFFPSLPIIPHALAYFYELCFGRNSVPSIYYWFVFMAQENLYRDLCTEGDG
jgi:hypothetical protein